MYSIRQVIRTLERPSWLIVLLSVMAAAICVRLGWSVDLPQPLVATAVIFPLAFSINAAYGRRAEALGCQSSIAAHTAMLFFAHRDWVSAGGETHACRVHSLIVRLWGVLRITLRDGKDVDQQMKVIYALFSEFSRSIELLRDQGLKESEVSNANQCLRAIIQDVERLRRILLYPTPNSLRNYTKSFLYGLPILLGPYFAYLAAAHGVGMGLFVAAMYSLILVSLQHVQEQLDNPFDGKGADDDVDLDTVDFYSQLLSTSPHERAA